MRYDDSRKDVQQGGDTSTRSQSGGVEKLKGIVLGGNVRNVLHHTWHSQRSPSISPTIFVEETGTAPHTCTNLFSHLCHLILQELYEGDLNVRAGRYPATTAGMDVPNGLYIYAHCCIAKCAIPRETKNVFC